MAIYNLMRNVIYFKVLVWILLNNFQNCPAPRCQNCAKLASIPPQLLDQLSYLVSPAYQVQVVSVQELGDNICTKCEAHLNTQMHIKS